MEHIQQNQTSDSRGQTPSTLNQWFHLTVGHHKTIIRLLSTQAFKGSKSFVPTNASKTSNVTHNFHQASRAFVQPVIPGLVTQPTKGFQSIFPTKASKTSNSTHQGLPEHLSNQGF